MAEDNIKVCVRVRPVNAQEERFEKEISVWQISETALFGNTADESRRVSAIPGKSSQTFEFDRVFGPNSSTDELFEFTVKRIVEGVVEGINGTIFAYGQTASGKTHTMTGSSARPGLIPMAINHVFRLISSSSREFLLRISYMEVYNEVVNDMLESNSIDLKVLDDPKRGVVIQGLREEMVISADQVIARMSAGEEIRHIGRTNMNEASSRSHAVFRLTVESNPAPDADGEAKGGGLLASLYMVDLAGSERISRTGASGDRMREGAMINRSLLTLGKIIYSLSKGGAAHLPFRDSKLTRILRPSLEGQARVGIVATVTPALINYEESCSTLQFASRAKLIKTQAKVNELLDERTTIQRLRKEIDELRNRLSRKASMVADMPQTTPADTGEETEALEAKIDNLNKMILSSSAVAERAKEETLAKATQVQTLERELARMQSQLRLRDAKLDEATNQLKAMRTLLDMRDRELKETKSALEQAQQALQERDIHTAVTESTRATARNFDGEGDLMERLSNKLASAELDIVRATSKRLLRQSSNLLPLVDVHHAGRAGTGAEAAVQRAIRAMATSPEVVLAWKSIGNDGAVAIADAMAGQNIALLNLEWNRIGEPGAVALAEAIRGCNTLHTLLLGGNCLADTGAQALANGMMQAPCLTSVDLKWNRIGDEGIRAVADLLRTDTPPLVHLDLAKNYFGDESVRMIADAIGQHGTALKTLGLSGTRMTDVGALTLSQALRLRTVPVTVLVWATRMSDSGVESLMAAAGDIHTIVTVEPAGQQQMRRE